MVYICIYTVDVFKKDFEEYILIELKNISKSLGDFRLKDISFEIPKGYIMGIVGENGSGKTSLLHILMGLYEYEEGELYFDGKDFSEYKEEIKDEIGFVFAESLFVKQLSLIDNADIYGAYYSKYDKDIFLDYCKKFELDEKSLLGKCSRGERMKFQFAFALAHDPKYLFLDEPTSSFDPVFRDEFIHILTDFVKDGEHTVLLVTHLTDVLDRIADYITFVKDGKIEFSLDIENLQKTYLMLEGEDYKLNPYRDRIIHEEKGSFGSKALVKHIKYTRYDNGIDVRGPSVEEVMYYLVKGRTRK